MAIDRTTLLFFDASCLIAAVGSPAGGSGFLLSLCRRGLLAGAASHPVLLEAERNIADKLGIDALARFHHLLLTTPLAVIPVPTHADRRRYWPAINEKDDHVVAAAIAAHAPFLVTLDKGLAAEVNGAGLPIAALSPGDFIRGLLPTHPDYPAARE